MKAVGLTLIAVVAAAALAQPALAGRTDYVWLNNSAQQTNVQQASGAGPVMKPEPNSPFGPHGDYFFLANQPRQASGNQGCQCAQCGAGPNVMKSKAQPQKSQKQTKESAADQTQFPWNF